MGSSDMLESSLGSGLAARLWFMLSSCYEKKILDKWRKGFRERIFLAGIKGCVSIDQCSTRHK